MQFVDDGRTVAPLHSHLLDLTVEVGVRPETLFEVAAIETVHLADLDCDHVSYPHLVLDHQRYLAKVVAILQMTYLQNNLLSTINFLLVIPVQHFSPDLFGLSYVDACAKAENQSGLIRQK